ncbi:hypothetical protein B0H14DRAFT_2626603 [Mycena olivaceomarginata]|nr:hypothetical protein B0H14DRAFT_2626603 [Mycena olivaceomarginata]
MARKFDGRDVNQSDSHVSLKDFTRKDFKPSSRPGANFPPRSSSSSRPPTSGSGLPAQFRGGGLHIASNCRVCSEKDRLRKQEKRNGEDPEKENALTGVSKDDPDDRV